MRDAFERIKRNTFSKDLRDATGEMAAYDQHSADLATETFERKDLGLKDGLEIDRAKIDLALDRIAGAPTATVFLAAASSLRAA